MPRGWALCQANGRCCLHATSQRGLIKIFVRGCQEGTNISVKDVEEKAVCISE